MTGEVCENAIYLLEDTLRDLKSLFNNAKDLKAASRSISTSTTT